MRETANPSNLGINIGDSFYQARDLTVQRLQKMGQRDIQFGSCRIKADRYAQFLSEIPSTKVETLQFLKEEGKWFEVYGRAEWSEILLTSYFSPLYEARRKPEGEYTQPLYRIPTDLVEVSLKSFDSEQLVNLKTDRSVVSARIKQGPGKLKRIVPYFSREEIDIQKSLSGQNLEIAYLDPIDAFFIQIQGSGKVKFKDGEILSLGYGAQNGYRYNSVGRLLYHLIPKEEMSMARIEAYLESLTSQDLYRFLSQNPSYVFFKDLESKPAVTTLGIQVFDKITLAVDPSLFPLGAMG
ncbi:MAG: MltA domain-containing protein, partial [Halobacteriovoraceae bacterium]|nr:MltA domain-containing protein [Halobacteriovoraceae bacterium]